MSALRVRSLMGVARPQAVLLAGGFATVALILLASALLVADRAERQHAAGLEVTRLYALHSVSMRTLALLADAGSRVARPS